MSITYPDSLTHEQTADYRVISLAGSPEAIGRVQAAYLRPVGAPLRRNPWEEDRAFLCTCAAIVAGFHAPLWDELAAFADALSLPAERALFVRAGALPRGCSPRCRTWRRSTIRWSTRAAPASRWRPIRGCLLRCARGKPGSPSPTTTNRRRWRRSRGCARSPARARGSQR